MDSFWESKYKNSEKSIQFLQEAHSDTLKGLHEEIDSLQKQCSEYALTLSMRATTALEKDELDKKFKSFNAEYKKKDALIVEQKALIDERNKNIKSLNERIKSLEKKHEAEINSKDLLMKQLKKELEIKSNQIANLTYQIHNLNKMKSSVQILDSYIVDKSLDVNSNESSKAIKKKINKSLQENKSKEILEQNFEHIPVLSPRQQNKKESTERRSSSVRSLQCESSSNIELTQTENDILKIRTNRSNSSNSLSASHTDRSGTPPIFQKVLPPVIKQNIPLPDPKPFLQAAACTLYTNSSKELIKRRTLISLPPIKPFELNQIAVESPIKLFNGANSKILNEHRHNQNDGN